MYSILIVDDERFMREGIAKILPWRKLNIDYVETADSGTTALERMHNHMPDIVLTDIEMENMNGITLIRQMNQLNPKLRIVVLTGHDDFSYVQECCRMEVHDYLLKPVELDKLTDVVAAQVAALEQQDKEENHSRLVSRTAGLAEQGRVEHAFHEFLKHRTGHEEICQILKDYGWKEGETFQAAIIASEASDHTDMSGAHHELQDLSASNACIELVEYQRHGVSFRNGSNALVLILFRSALHPDTSQLMEQVQTVLQNEYDTPQKAYLGNPVDTVSQIPDSYADAVLLRDSQKRSRSVIQMQAEQDRSMMLFQMEPEVLRDILEMMDEPQQAILAFDDYCYKLGSYQLSTDIIRRSCYQLVSSVYYCWTEKNGTADAPSLTDLMAKIQTADEAAVYSSSRIFLENLLSNGQQRTGDVIANVKRYISRHLAEDLSVSSLAARYYLSAPYFSKLFKKTEGVGCNYYIICQRMEAARHLLLSSSLRVGDIAEQVGYRDVNYFSLAFKKYTGISPGEYRNKGKKGDF